MFTESGGATTFTTAIGVCGLTWTGTGIATVHLPEDKPAMLRSRIAAVTDASIMMPDAVPEPVRDTTVRIAAVTRGADDDLGDLPLDMTGLTEFATSIYRALRKVPPGDTVTYGELAHRAGYHSANMPRAVGQVLGRNPFGIVVPCHRVLAADGRIGGFSAHGGVVTKIRLLRAEGRGEAAASMPYDVNAGERYLREADRRFATIIDRIQPIPRMRVASSTVAGLAEAIVGQQVSGAAARSIYARLCVLFPKPLDGPTAKGLAQLSDAELRGAGLSASKVASLRDLTARSLAGEVPELDELAAMGDDEIIERLTPIRGIGRWTVEMLLIFRLGRPDVLPVDDLAVRRGYERMAGIGHVTPTGLRVVGEAWAPWRSLASWYLWRASELA